MNQQPFTTMEQKPLPTLQQPKLPTDNQPSSVTPGNLQTNPWPQVPNGRFDPSVLSNLSQRPGHNTPPNWAKGETVGALPTTTNPTAEHPKAVKPAAKPFPSYVPAPKPNVAGIQFTGDDPMNQLLQETWTTELPKDYQTELSSMPANMLKAYLFFFHFRDTTVKFNDKQMTGAEAAQGVLDNFRKGNAAAITYNQQLDAAKAKQRIANQNQQVAALPTSPMITYR